MCSLTQKKSDTHTFTSPKMSIGYTIVWSSIHECNECISRQTMV